MAALPATTAMWGALGAPWHQWDALRRGKILACRVRAAVLDWAVWGLDKGVGLEPVLKQPDAAAEAIPDEAPGAPEAGWELGGSAANGQASPGLAARLGARQAVPRG